MRVTRYRTNERHLSVDFFADPDGEWEFESLLAAAGFDPEEPGISVGALAAPFDGHPEGAAVISRVSGKRMVGRFCAVVDCTQVVLARPVPSAMAPNAMAPNAMRPSLVPFATPANSVHSSVAATNGAWESSPAAEDASRAA